MLVQGLIHWIGLRENLQETMVFTTKYRAFLQIFPSSNSMINRSTMDLLPDYL